MLLSTSSRKYYTTINTNETERICHTPISRSLAHSKVHLSIRIFTKLSDSITNILTYIIQSNANNMQAQGDLLHLNSAYICS